MRHGFRSIATAFVALLILSSACRQEKKEESIILRREWLANAEFAGDIWASRIAKEQGFDLEVRQGGELFDPIKEVRAGVAHFGVVSADRVLRENEAGAGLVIVAAATYREAACLTDTFAFLRASVSIDVGQPIPTSINQS